MYGTSQLTKDIPLEARYDLREGQVRQDRKILGASAEEDLRAAQMDTRVQTAQLFREAA